MPNTVNDIGNVLAQAGRVYGQRFTEAGSLVDRPVDERLPTAAPLEEEVRSLRRDINNLHRRIGKLETHRHGQDGTVLVPIYSI